MILVNNTSAAVAVTVTNNNGSQVFSGNLAAGNTENVPLSSDFTYEVCGTSENQKVCRSGLVSDLTVTFVIVNGVLQIQIS